MRGAICCLALLVLASERDAGPMPVSAGRIAGRVRNTDGKGIPGATIWLLRPENRDGHTEYRVERTTVADQEGDYKFEGLTGTYVVRAAGFGSLKESVRDEAPEPQSHETFAPLYIGGATLPEKALLIAADMFPRRQADFLVQLRQGHAIRGKIANSVRYQQKSAQLFREGWDAQENRVSIGLANGRFEIDDVLDGKYRLLVTQKDDHGRKAYAETQVEVADHDVDGIALTVTPGQKVRVAPRFDVSRAGQDAPVWTRVRLCLPEKFPRSSMPRCYGATYTAANGEQELWDVPAGRYRVSIDSGPFYVKSATAGGVDLIRNPETLVDEHTPPIQVVLGADGGNVFGTVPPSVLGRSEVTILLAPESDSGLPRITEPYTHNDGRFHFQGVAPGVYRLHLLKKAPEVDYAAPEILRILQRTGRRVEVKPNGEVKIEIDQWTEAPR